MTDGAASAAEATWPRATAIRLRAPGRLHLGFLDPSATLGRRFGSIGLVVDGFETALELRAAAADSVECGGEARRADGSQPKPPPSPPSDALHEAPRQVAAGDLERAAAHLAALRERTGWRQPLQLRLLHTLPSHAGFGSGTQLALAVGMAFVRLRAALHGAALDAASCPGAPAIAGEAPTSATTPSATAPSATTPSATAIAGWLGRGARSGVGIAGFEHGGLLLDGGPAADGTPARLLSRVDFPADWRVVVVMDPRHRGLSGAGERQALAALPPLPQAAAADICHQALMRVLPGAAGAEFAPFAAGVTRIQQLLGEHFAPAQGGNLFSSAAVGELLGWMTAHAGHPLGVGQSSWGPTGFAIVPSQRAAETLVAAAAAARPAGGALVVRIVRGLNHGAVLSAAGIDPA